MSRMLIGWPATHAENRLWHKKSPGRCRGLSLLEIGERSVTRDDRSLAHAELVVQANGDQIDVLTDAVGYRQSANRPDTCDSTGRKQANGSIAHKKVIV